MSKKPFWSDCCLGDIDTAKIKDVDYEVERLPLWRIILGIFKFRFTRTRVVENDIERTAFVCGECGYECSPTPRTTYEIITDKFELITAKDKIISLELQARLV